MSQIFDDKNDLSKAKKRLKSSFLSENNNYDSLNIQQMNTKKQKINECSICSCKMWK